jgi:hypothetical protein
MLNLNGYSIGIIPVQNIQPVGIVPVQGIQPFGRDFLVQNIQPFHRDHSSTQYSVSMEFPVVQNIQSVGNFQ